MPLSAHKLALCSDRCWITTAVHLVVKREYLTVSNVSPALPVLSLFQQYNNFYFRFYKPMFSFSFKSQGTFFFNCTVSFPLLMHFPWAVQEILCVTNKPNLCWMIDCLTVILREKSPSLLTQNKYTKCLGLIDSESCDPVTPNEWSIVVLHRSRTHLFYMNGNSEFLLMKSFNVLPKLPCHVTQWLRTNAMQPVKHSKRPEWTSV